MDYFCKGQILDKDVCVCRRGNPETMKLHGTKRYQVLLVINFTI